MKVSQLLFLALFAIVGSAIAQDDEAHEQVNCDAVCVSKVEDTWTQANREIRAANEKLEHASEQVNARDNEINELRGEIRGLRDNLGAVEGAVNDGRVALATAQEEGARALTTSQEEGARALGAQSRKAAAAEGKLATMQVELDAAKAEAAEFASSRFLVNVNVIQKDFKHFLKKLGLIKSDECCDL